MVLGESNSEVEAGAILSDDSPTYLAENPEIGVRCSERDACRESEVCCRESEVRCRERRALERDK